MGEDKRALNHDLLRRRGRRDFRKKLFSAGRSPKQPQRGGKKKRGRGRAAVLHQQERGERKRAPKTNALHKLQIVVLRRSVGCFRSRGTSPIKKSLPLGDLFVWKELVRTQLQRGYPSSDKLEYFPYQLTPVVANFSTGAQSPFEWLFSQPVSYSGSRMFFDAALGKVSEQEGESRQ